MLSGPSSVAKQSALLCNSWLRKICACSQMLRYNPAAGLPRRPIGLWCGTLGVDRHGLFQKKSLKCLFILLSSMTRCHRTMQRAYRSWVSNPFLEENSLLLLLPHSSLFPLWGHLPWPPVSPQGCPFLSASSKPQSPKKQWASSLRMQCGQHGTTFSQYHIIWSSALLLAWPGFE